MNNINSRFLTVLLTTSFGISAAHSTPLALATAPLFTVQKVAPLVMLVMGRDHTLYYEAYNDASDLDGGGLDIKFKPGISYEGYFDPDKCYSYVDADNLFTPERKAVAVTRACTNTSEWSGNFLNYLTMTRMDVLRKVLYGGYRSTDSRTETILERVYIPRDGHSWAKAYKADDGYDIADYAPFTKPTDGKQHFFGSVTYESNAHKADNQTDSPLLQVIIGAENVRNLADWGVWNWASTERPVLNMDPNKINADGMSSLSDLASDGEVDKADYTVRVKVCVPGTNLLLLENNCKAYKDGTTTIYKPTGLLHDYGGNDQMLFGLLTGSYNKNLSGGVLRKKIAKFSQEIAASTGIFTSAAGGIVDTINKLRINGFDYNYNNQYSPDWSGKFTQSLIQGQYTDWGNPIGEMLYESLRYFSGASAASSTYAASGGDDATLGLPAPEWDDPYVGTGRETCSRANNLLISDINPSYDSDQLPGAYSEFAGTYTGSELPDFDISDLLSTISMTEKFSGKYFIGQSGATTDGAPTAKEITGLGSVRGLAPAEPTKKGSYTSAGVAYYGLKNDIHTSKKKAQNVRTMVVALASNLPEIDVEIDNHIIKIVPFAKSVGGNSINAASGGFQPTNTIVDWYVESQSATQGTFRINFEDVEQGNDHDMDMVVKYAYEVKDLCFAYKNNDPNKACETYKKGVQITLDSTYAAGGIDQHAGYIISGTTNDNLYLEVKDKHGSDVKYYLDTPDSFDYQSRAASGSNNNLSLFATRYFFPSETPAASFLPSPLFYAAKWGGFVDSNNNGVPDGTNDSEWDANGDGLPDTYFPVTNAGELKSQLGKAFDAASKDELSTTAPIFSSHFLTQGTLSYQSAFEGETWSGDIKVFAADASGKFSSTPNWSAAAELAKRTAPRKIFTRNDSSGTVFEMDEPGDLIGANDSYSQVQLDLLLGEVTGTDAEKLTYLQTLVNYLRGDRSQEADDITINKMRKRGAMLGDIINSTPYYVAPINGHNVVKKVLVFGANDGMVHVIDVADGKELMAYVPSTVYGQLNALANVNYTHQYSVDGGISGYTKPATETDTAKTTTVGTLGTGVRGLYAIDVSNMTTPASTMMEWEITPARSGYSELGFTNAAPTIAKLANGSVGVVFANGYNSTDTQATIYIADLDDGTLIKKLTTKTLADPTGNNRPNAMASPAVVDFNGDGVADRIYAGDLFGNMWVFDITDEEPDEWTSAIKDAGNNPAPLFTATSPTIEDTKYLSQPITTRPSVGRHPSGTGFLIAFGTGKYIESTDTSVTDQATQSFYIVWDKKDGSAISGVRSGTNHQQSKLLAQEITMEDAKNRQLSSNVINWTTHDGFYIDLINTHITTGGNKGERQVIDSLLIANKVRFTTLIPNEDPCTAGGTGWYMELNLHTGQTWYKGSYVPSAEDIEKGNTIADDSSNQKIDGIASAVNVINVPVPESDPDTEPDPDTDAKPKEKNCVTLTTGGVVCFDGPLPPLGRLGWRQLYD